MRATDVKGTGEPAGPARWVWLAWLPIVAYSGLIFYLSSRTFPTLERLHALSFDKILHLGAFGVWAVFFGMALVCTRPRLAVRPLIWIIVLSGSLYGASDELHQSFVPGRVFDPWDWVADTLGALGGALVVVRARARVARGWNREKKVAPRGGRSGE